MNRKGMEMAISTIIWIIIGIVVLIGLVVFITKGFGLFKEGTEPVLKTSRNNVVKQACEIACRGEDSRTFCCEPFKVDGKNVYCKNSSLNLDCNYDCSEVVCS
ncbi:hypothetical protein J4423_05065 [Candidatus Pacearchaeota archaeon]|nr:hypothetical protein [Candidatus Pacearchaeota archaeon]